MFIVLNRSDCKTKHDHNVQKQESNPRGMNSAPMLFRLSQRFVKNDFFQQYTRRGKGDENTEGTILSR